MDYVDDDTDCVSDPDPEVLKEKITREAGNSVQWLQDNRLCVAADKSKLLVTGTQQLRSAKVNTDISVVVNGETLEESSSERLLGLVINNQLSWKNYLYGDTNNQGLIPQLSKRVGMLKALSKYLPKENLKPFIIRIFYSELNYCLAVFGNIFGLEKYKEENRSYTISDNNKLQILQNQVNRLLVDVDPLTSTADLVRLTDSLSVHQMVAHQTAVLTHRIVQSGKPQYIADRLKPREANMKLRGGQGALTTPHFKLSLSREGFIYRGATLFNKLDEHIRTEKDIKKFKKRSKIWVKENIPIKPMSLFSKIIQRQKKDKCYSAPETITNQVISSPAANQITRYFKPIRP